MQKQTTVGSLRAMESVPLSSIPLSGQLPWRAPEQDSFWELHRRLGKCYEAAVGNRRVASSEAMPSRKAWPYSRSSDSMNFFAVEQAPSGPLCSPVRMRSAPDELPPLGGLSPKALHYGSGELSPVVPAPAVPAPRRVQAQTPPNCIEPPVNEASETLSESSQEPTQTFQGYYPRTCWIERSRSHLPRRRSMSAEVTKSVQVVPDRPAPYVFSPTGHFRNAWDFFGIIFLMKDAVVIPLQLAQVNLYAMFPALLIISQVALLYWCADIPISFLTGFLRKGSLVQDYKQIARHYLLTWFTPDVAVTVTDLFILFSDDTLTDGPSTTRILRFLRLFRLIRLGKLTRVSAFLRDYFESQVASIQFSLLLVMLGNAS